jgi:hypothetical protein
LAESNERRASGGQRYSSARIEPVKLADPPYKSVRTTKTKLRWAQKTWSDASEMVSKPVVLHTNEKDADKGR